MNALILAAGRGTRLGSPDDLPKCLTPVGRETILDRYLDALARHGIPATIVVGHGADRIAAHLAAREATASCVYNPRYREGSVVSLQAGLEAVEGPLLTLDGDVVFTPALLGRLVTFRAPDALLVDVGTQFTDEQYMAGMRGSRVVALRRGPADGCESQGEWVGFAKLSGATANRLREAVRAQVARGENGGGYEDALAGLLGDVEVACVPTGGAQWVEIDFPADLERARRLVALLNRPVA